MKNFKITVNGNIYDVAVEEVSGGNTPVATHAPTAVAPPISAPAPKSSPAPKASASGTKVTAPMPGKVTSISVSVGQDVKKGAVLLAFEAMKMENEILSPCDGKVETLNVSKGSNIESGDLLISIV